MYIAVIYRGRPKEKDLVCGGEKWDSICKRRGLILTIGLNQQHLRMFAKVVNQIEQ